MIAKVINSTEPMGNISTCGAANLLSAVLRVPKEQILVKWGIWSTCIDCGKPLSPEKSHEGQCYKCYFKSRHVKVECDYCGILFERYQSQLIYTLGKNHQRHIFCGRECFYKWLGLGKNYGFGSPRETLRQKQLHGAPRKWNWEEVWHLHQQTGWGSLRLSRALNIPESTIKKILQKKKLEAKSGKSNIE